MVLNSICLEPGATAARRGKQETLVRVDMSLHSLKGNAFEAPVLDKEVVILLKRISFLNALTGSSSK